MYGDIDPDAAREQAKEREDDELLAEVEEYLDMPMAGWLRKEFDEILELAAERRSQEQNDDE